jgi:hypothetical protein
MRIALFFVTILALLASPLSFGGDIKPLFCARNSPVVTFVNPSPSATILGQTLSYSFTVQNTDYSGCLPSTFSLTMAYAAGLTPRLSATNLTLNAGASAIVTLQVAAIPLVDGKSYSILLTTKNAGAPESMTTSQLYYRVALPTPCVRTNPTVTFSKPSQTATAAGQELDYIIAVKNNDTATCGISVFTVAPTLDAGLTSTMPFNKLILNPAQASTALIKVTSNVGIASQTYKVVGTAVNASVTTEQTAATAIYILKTTMSESAPPGEASVSMPEAGAMTTDDGMEIEPLDAPATPTSSDTELLFRQMSSVLDAESNTYE